MEMNSIFNWKLLLEILENNSLGEELIDDDLYDVDEIMIICEGDGYVTIKTDFVSNETYHSCNDSPNMILIPSYKHKIMKNNIYITYTMSECENTQFISNVKYKKDGEEAEKIYRGLVAKIRNYCEKNNLI